MVCHRVAQRRLPMHHSLAVIVLQSAPVAIVCSAVTTTVCSAKTLPKVQLGVDYIVGKGIGFEGP